VSKVHLTAFGRLLKRFSRKGGKRVNKSSSEVEIEVLEGQETQAKQASVALLVVTRARERPPVAGP
jgi:hypothetical protein